MISQFRTIVFAIAILGLVIHQSDAAEPGIENLSTPRSSKPMEKRKHRRLKTESNQGSKSPPAKRQPTEKSVARYQMLSAGERVIVLDTHTGETKVIEPQPRPPYQNVEVGRAWVVVTVLGNVSERSGPAVSK
jgi:hypothetical protein